MQTSRGFLAIAFELDHPFERTSELGAFNYGLCFRRRDLDVGRRQTHQILDHRPVVFDVLFLLTFFHFEERRLRDVNVTLLDQLWHLPEEEGEQQGADMRAVNIGVSHQNDPVIAQLAEVKILFADAGAERRDQRFDFAVPQHLVEPRFLDV